MVQFACFMSPPYFEVYYCLISCRFKNPNLSYPVSGLTKSRIETDEHGRRATFEEIEVGKDLGVIEWTVSEADIDKQCMLDDDPHPWFMVDSPFDGRIAPPQIQYRPPRWLLSRNYNIRGVFYKWEFENVKPIRPNVKIKVTGRITDKWIKNDREFVEFETVAHDDTGDLLFRTLRVHVLDIIDNTAPRAGIGVDSGVKAEKI